MTTHSNYSLQNFSTSNARVLTGISQPVSEIMALCNQGIISQENISGIDNSNGNLILREKILGIDNSNRNLPLENEDKVKAETEAKEKAEDEEDSFENWLDKLQQDETKKKVKAKAKAKEEQLKKNFLSAKLTLKKEHYNLSSKSEGQKQDEANDKYRSISQLDAIFKSKQIQGITTKEQEKVEGLDSIKLEQAQSIDKKDEKYNIIKPEKAQGINKQDSKSEKQERDEEYGIIKPALDQEKDQEVDQETDPGAYQEVDQEEYAKADDEAKKKAETEAKAGGEEEHYSFYDHTTQPCAQNSNLIKYRLLYENENLYDLMFANSTLNIQIFRRFKEARTNTTRDLLFNCNDEYDPTRKSILSELTQISKCGLRAADIFFNKFLSEMQKTEADQEADQDVDQNLDQESDQEAYQTADQHADQEINQEEHQKEHQEEHHEADQETDQNADQETDQEANQEPDQEPDQETDQEPDQETDQGPDQEADQEPDQEPYQEHTESIPRARTRAYREHTKSIPKSWLSATKELFRKKIFRELTTPMEIFSHVKKFWELTTPIKIFH